MATFYNCDNNGVTAIMTEADYQKLLSRQELVRECEEAGLPRPQLPPVKPVFTFSSPNHPSFSMMTGSRVVMEQLLEGHVIRPGCIYVPFSNGIEHGNDENAIWERNYRTNLDQAISAFGLKI